MDKELIKHAFFMIDVIVLSGAFTTASFSIDLPWEEEGKVVALIFDRGKVLTRKPYMDCPLTYQKVRVRKLMELLI